MYCCWDTTGYGLRGWQQQWKTRSMDLKVWKLRERPEVQEVDLKWCSAKDEQSNINMKALPTKQFRYLWDNLSGYALVMLHYPEIQMPDACINRSELIIMISELCDDERARNEKKNGKKKKRKSRIWFDLKHEQSTGSGVSHKHRGQLQVAVPGFAVYRRYEEAPRSAATKGRGPC